MDVFSGIVFIYIIEKDFVKFFVRYLNIDLKGIWVVFIVFNGRFLVIFDFESFRLFIEFELKVDEVFYYGGDCSVSDVLWEVVGMFLKFLFFVFKVIFFVIFGKFL